MPMDPKLQKLREAQSRTATPISPGASLMPPSRGGGLPGQSGSPFKRGGAVGGRRAGRSGGSGQQLAELMAQMQGGQSKNTPGASFGPGGPSAVGGGANSVKDRLVQQITQRRQGEAKGRPDAVSRRLGR